MGEQTATRRIAASKWWVAPLITVVIVILGAGTTWGITTATLDNVKDDIADTKSKVEVLEKQEDVKACKEDINTIKVKQAEITAEQKAQRDLANEKLSSFGKVLEQIQKDVRWLARRNGRKYDRDE